MGYIRRPTISAALCDVCGFVLELVSQGKPAAIDALNVTFTGGPKQFFNGPPVELVLCEKCANKLMAAFPVIELKPALASCRVALEKFF